MTRSGATAAGRADRFFELSLIGLATSGYLALIGSGRLDSLAAVLAVHLVFGLAVVRTLTARSNRHYAYVGIVAFLGLLSAAMLSANLSFLLFLGAFLLFLVATLASAEVRRSTRGPMLVARGGLHGFYARLASLSLLVALGILALTAGLFFVLPRTAHAAFNRLLAERYHLPGFSGEVRLGQIGAILQRSEPAMHVRVIDAAGPLALKWRGAALSSFDGKRWFNPTGDAEIVRIGEGRAVLVGDEQRRRAGPRITYEVQLETIASDGLFFAGLPEVLWIDSPSVTRTAAGVYRLKNAPRERLRYGAISYLDERVPENVPAATPALGAYLQLPAIDGRIEALARRVTSRASSDETRATALQDHLGKNFEYTTELPLEAAADPLADFLFTRRKGHCEYFASSMAVMLRTLGIPSRLVTGFRGGVLNPISGWHVVRASDAHAWVEAWIPGRGWTTFDPTPAGPQPPRQALWARLFFYMDAAEMFWQDWVVNYDLERQVILASRMQSSSRVFGSRWFDRLRLAWLEWQAAALRVVRAYGGIALALVVIGVAGWWFTPKASGWWKTRRRVREAQRGGARASDATLLYSRMLHLLKRRGYRKQPWLTPAEFARALPASETAQLVASLTCAYHELRYGDKLEAAPRMVSLLGQLERLG
jgi:transglutaminase-like putative cysteine protease